MSLKSTAAVTEPSQPERTMDVEDSEIEASRTIPLSQPPAPLTFSTAPTWFASETPMLSERPPEIVAPPQASPQRAAAMKRIVLSAVGGCLVIVLVAGWRVWQHRRVKAMEQQTMAIVTSPSPAPAAEPVAAPSQGEGASVASGPDGARQGANAAPSVPSSVAPSTSATAPSSTASSLRHAPAHTVKSHAPAPHKPGSTKRK
jgi:hypothetical protein